MPRLKQINKTSKTLLLLFNNLFSLDIVITHRAEKTLKVIVSTYISIMSLIFGPLDAPMN